MSLLWGQLLASSSQQPAATASCLSTDKLMAKTANKFRADAMLLKLYRSTFLKQTF